MVRSMQNCEIGQIYTRTRTYTHTYTQSMQKSNLLTEFVKNRRIQGNLRKWITIVQIDDTVFHRSSATSLMWRLKFLCHSSK